VWLLQVLFQLLQLVKGIAGENLESIKARAKELHNLFTLGILDGDFVLDDGLELLEELVHALALPLEVHFHRAQVLPHSQLSLQVVVLHIGDALLQPLSIVLFEELHSRPVRGGVAQQSGNFIREPSTFIPILNMLVVLEPVVSIFLRVEVFGHFSKTLEVLAQLQRQLVILRPHLELVDVLLTLPHL